MDAPPTHSFPQILTAEYDHLGRRLTSATLDRLYDEIHRHPGGPTAALCLSGGGIRSATFGLGVLQGLAENGLLDKIDYLSTVSGGGYVGGWLSAWIHRAGMKSVIDQLAQRDPADPLCPEAEPIRNLRAYSNYLSPKVGVLSADVWASVATYIRNLLLNLLVLIPMLLAVLLIPRICITIVALAPALGGSLLPGVICLVLGVLSFIAAIRYLALDMPSRSGQGRPESAYFIGHLVPLLLAVVLVSLGWALLAPVINGDWKVILSAAVLGGLGHSIGYKAGRQNPPLSSLTLGLAGGAASGLLFVEAFPNPSATAGESVTYVVWAAPCLLAVMMLAGVLYVGWRSYNDQGMGDQDREWWARSGGWVLVWIVIWLFASTLVLYVPSLLINSGAWIQAWIAGSGGLSGAAAALIGWSARTPLGQAGKSKWIGLTNRLATGILVPFFTIVLLAFLALGTSYVIFVCLGAPAGEDILDTVLGQASLLPLAGLVAAFLLLIGVGYGTGVRLSVNRFSMHGYYRNRLIRAYLGASRARQERTPDLFTGFDPNDNLTMETLRTDAEGKAAQRPLHVVNMALNLAGGKELAWQNRKAISYTVSPLHVGSSYGRIGYLKPGEYTHGGLTLGTAMALSGAAVSPNQGYHSSPALALLMSVFNVRLGAWLPNPGKLVKDNWTKDGPSDPLIMLKEAVGMTDADHPWVNLSDGGHFENLAVYEMVRRRCRYIILSDASEDHRYDFECLANMIEKVRVDLGIRIEPAKPFQIRPKNSDPPTKRGALYRIRYSDVDQAPRVDPERLDGWLLYIKPGITGSEPRDILKYSVEHDDFPHETTADQFFDEAQFESYRELGRMSVAEICEGWTGPGTPAALFPFLMLAPQI